MNSPYYSNRPDYAGANYGGSPVTWQGPRGASTGGGQNGKYVWWDRNWVPFDPSNPQHRGLPQYDTYLNIAPGSTPYYANDVSSALMQNAFPGAASGYAFASQYLEPQRQQGVRDLLGMNSYVGAKNRADAYAKATRQQAYGNAAQKGAALYGNSTVPRQFKASSLLDEMNRANENAAAYSSRATDPYQIALQRQQIIEGGYQNPLADQVRGWIPGLEAQRVNNNVWSQIAGVASNILPYVGGRGGGGQNQNVGGYTWWGQRL